MANDNKFADAGRDSNQSNGDLNLDHRQYSITNNIVVNVFPNSGNWKIVGISVLGGVSGILGLAKILSSNTSEETEPSPDSRINIWTPTPSKGLLPDELIDKHIESLGTVNLTEFKKDLRQGQSSIIFEKYYEYEIPLVSPNASLFIEQLNESGGTFIHDADPNSVLSSKELSQRQAAFEKITIDSSENSTSIPDPSGVGGVFFAALISLICLKRKTKR